MDISSASPSASDPVLSLGVVMERQRQPSEWEDWRHRVAEVVIDEGQFDPAQALRPHLLHDNGHLARHLHLGLPMSLHRDEAEGYWLNLSSGHPVWFVMWRIDESDPARAWPELVTLSYHMAGRLLDAQERVDNLPLPKGVVLWLREFTEAHYRPEPKSRRRPASFQAPGRR